MARDKALASSGKVERERLKSLEETVEVSFPATDFRRLREFFADRGTTSEEQLRPRAASLLSFLRNPQKRKSFRSGDAAAFKRMLVEWLRNCDSSQVPELADLVAHEFKLGRRPKRAPRDKNKWDAAVCCYAMDPDASLRKVARICGLAHTTVRGWRDRKYFQADVAAVRRFLETFRSGRRETA